MKKALITGIAGQDGSYLAELLLSKGYEVFGLVRNEEQRHEHIEHIKSRITLLVGDVASRESIEKAVRAADPDEVYNLAAPSFMGNSNKDPVATTMTCAAGTLYLLEALRTIKPGARFFQASSSEMYGLPVVTDVHATLTVRPRSPYAIAKLHAHWTTINYRERYGMYAVSGVLFNHESPRRSVEFVTRKITDGVARIRLGLATSISLGNLDAQRDWGYVGDYVEAMWLSLQQEKPDDYLIATGELRSVRDFVQTAFAAIGIADWEKYVEQDARYMRPAEVSSISGDPSATFAALNWHPKTSFDEMVQMMVDADLKRLH